MNVSAMRSVLEEANNRRQRGWSGSQYLGSSSRNTFDPAPSFSTQHSAELEFERDMINLYKLPSSAEMLGRARENHLNIDFAALAAGPESGGPWLQIEAADRFVVFKRPPTADVKDNRIPGLEVMCAGRLDASLEEVASVFRSRSEVDHANTMEGLYAKNFIFGSLDREVPFSEAVVEEPQDCDEDPAIYASEQLNIKTSSFLRTTVFGRNEQWCYSDFFMRNKERDGFTISQSALPPFEPTPGRVVGAHARVDQLHGLNAAYLVNHLPNRKGLRVVYNAWFDDLKSIETSATSSDKSIYDRGNARRRSSGLRVDSVSSARSFESSTSNSDRSISSRSSSRRRSSGLSVLSTASAAALVEAADEKAHLRRLLSLAHGITKLPDLIRRRRFGIQVPADLDAIQVENTRCPCCTHSLAPVKMSFAMAASAIAKRSLRSLKMDTRRCYLCGYLVCIDCWSAEYMESTVGRVAAIVVCTRCHACVNACDYSEVYAADQDQTRGPVKIVADKPDSSPASLLTDFLAAAMMNSSAKSEDRAALVSVVRELLRQSESTGSESDEDYDDDSDYGASVDVNERDNSIALADLDNFLRDESQLLELESFEFANAERRQYVLDLPDNPATTVPPTLYPSHEETRLQLVNDKGLLLLANQLAPIAPAPGAFDNVCDVHDLDVLCQLAVRASGCANTFLSIMGTNHLHILSTSNPAFEHATMPREHTVCQHTIMTAKPFMTSHPEADVRFHELGAIKSLSTRCYVGFPLRIPVIGNNGTEETEMSVGTLCCVDPKARSELTRSQYTTLKRIADTASRLIQLKGRQLLQQHRPDSAEASLIA